MTKQAESKHTPGPWAIWDTKNGRQVGMSERPVMVATMCELEKLRLYPEEGHYPGSLEANARLIAAAPDLLEALKHMSEVFERELGPKWESVIVARAAIAKAEGR